MNILYAMGVNIQDAKGVNTRYAMSMKVEHVGSRKVLDFEVGVIHVLEFDANVKQVMSCVILHQRVVILQN